MNAEPIPTTQPSVNETTCVVTIAGITQPTVLTYFETLNASKFEATAALFAVDGVMHPPFEEGIVGPEAIATYLQKEAPGIKLEPREGIVQTIEDGIQVQVAGKVQTPMFGVNVSWLFILNHQHEIAYAKIKLLASPQELLNLRQ